MIESSPQPNSTTAAPAETKLDRMSRLIRAALRPQVEREIRRSHDNKESDDAV